MSRYPKPESSTLEFKREYPKNEQVIKTIIGFCNQHGGRLIIGVGNDGTIVGLPDQEIERALESLDKAIFEACAPPIIPQVYAQRMGEKSVLVIEVSKGMNKPYYRRSEGREKGVYIRIGRNTIRATEEMAEELRWQSHGQSFEELPVYRSSLDDLQLDRFSKFLRGRKNNGQAEADGEALASYGLSAQEHNQVYPTISGILLFGKTPQKFFSEAMIICSHFEGTEGRKALATVDCEGTLFDQFSTALEFVRGRLSRSFEIESIKRKEQLEIPEEALREALINAVIHRNYHLKSPTKIAIYADRIEIFSPGHFVGPVNSTNLRAGMTYLRNPGICRVFREAGIVEKLGTGLITIFDSYKKRGLATPQLIEGASFVKCILPRGKAQTQAPTKEAEEILTLFERADEISVSDVMTHMNVSRATAGRKLKQLIDSGILLREGQARSVRYRKK